MELIDTIQKQLEAVYGIRIGEQASQYLITKEELLDLMDSPALTTVPKELFLVNPHPQNDTLEVALFLDQALTENLTRHNPLETLSEKNLSDFCALIEGISHFVYYLHKSYLQHEITQLEMELQAEIDKFVIISLIIEKNEEGPDILDLLFEHYTLSEGLKHDQTTRYQTASNLAQRYCHALSQSLQTQKIPDLIKEIRRFYPLSQEQKIRHILQ